MQQMPRWTNCLSYTPRMSLWVRHTTRVPKMRLPLNSNALLLFRVILCFKHLGVSSCKPYRTSRTLGRIVRCVRLSCLGSCHSPTLLSLLTVSKRLKSVPILGSFHESDILNIYAGGDLTDFLIQFATNLDPNGISSPPWPQYTTSSPQLMTLLGDQVINNNRTITLDTYRVKEMEFLTTLSPAL